MRTTSIVSTLLAMTFAGAASASVAGMQGLYAKNYLLAADGSAATNINNGDGTWTGNAYYSVMDVYVKYNSAVGVGSSGERIVSYFGQATTDSATYGVVKSSKYENSAGLGFQQQRKLVARRKCQWWRGQQHLGFIWNSGVPRARLR